MKKITLLFVLSLLFSSVTYGQMFQVTTCLGTVASNTYGPMNSVATANATSRTAVIYPSSQLTGIAGQNLSSAYFSRYGAAGAVMAGSPNFKIYLKETTSVDFGAGALDWATQIATATLVYNSDPTASVGNSVGYKGFPFSTNFLYSGVQNLAVYMEYSNSAAMPAAVTWEYEFQGPCISTANSSTTKYSNNTTGVLSPTLGSQDYRRPFIGFDFIVSCNAPSTLTASNITTTTATVNWVENAIQPVNGYEYYYSTTNTPPAPTATPNGVTANGVIAANLTGLSSGTTYYFWVRGNCGATDKSIWSGPLTFTTTCAPVTDFIQAFETLPTGVGNLPNCWSKLGTSANVYTTTGSVAPMSPANRLYMNISATTTAFAILPPVTNLQAATHRLKFKAYATAASKKVRVGYFTNIADVNTFTLIQEIDLPSTAATTALEFAVYPTSVPAGVSNLVLTLPEGTATTAYFDDFKWELSPACPDVTGLVVGGITATGANVSWDAITGTTGYEYAVTTSATPPATGTATTNTFAIISGLLPQTAYYLHVRSSCTGGTFGIWTTSASFTTGCATVTSFVENFDASPTGAGNLPPCWNRAGTSANVYNTTGSVAPMSPSNRLYMNISATTSAFAILPQVSNLQAGTHRLKFKAYATAASKKVRVGYFTNATDLTTFTLIQEIDLPSTAATTALEFAVYPTSVPAGVSNLVLTLPEGTATTAYFDDFKWELSPACPDVTGLVVGGITATGANVSWDAITGTTGYEYAVTTSATPPATGTATTNTFAIISGLLPQTAYYLHVRSSCTGGTFGAWTTSPSFTTACAPIAAPVLEPFNTFLPTCWTNRFGGDLATGPAATGTSGWVADGFANNGTTGAIRNEIFTTGANDWVISPEITIPATGYELKFDAAATQFAAVTAPTTPWEADDTIEVLVSTTGLTNWTPLFTYGAGNQPSNTGSPKIIGLNAYANQTIRIAFRAVEGAANGNADIDFSIDNFQVRLTPSCADVLNVVSSGTTTTSINISWDAATPAPAAGYQYVVSTSNVTPTAAGTATTNTFAAVTGLSPQTTYYVFVRSVCSATDFGAWSVPITFFTGYCTPSSTSAASYINDFTTTGGSQNISNLASGFTAGGYLNATTQSVQGFATSSFSFNAVIAGPTVGFAIWVDWNNDLAFDNATEKVFNTTAYGNGPFTGTVSIPAGTAIGNYRMRIVTDFNALNPTETCALRPRAEYEDYTISVVAPPACVPPVPAASSVTSATATLTWPAVTTAASGYEYVLNNVATDPTGAGTATTALTYSATGLTQLTQYYFHLRSVCSAGVFSTWSTTSFTTLATPPVNDNCATALVLTPGGTFANNPLIASNVGATNSTPPAPGCALFNGGDVWYSVVVPASGSITVETNSNTGPIADTGMAVYSGTCAGLVLVECDDDDSADGNFSLIALTNRTPGEVLYINAWEYGNDAFGTFKISAYDASLGTNSFNNNGFAIYPNPVKNILNINYNDNITKIQVINMLGQEIITKSVNNTQSQVDMSGLVQGTYLVKVTANDVVKTIKVIKE